MALGSRQLILDKYQSDPTDTSKTEAKIKTNIDVVITLANIIDNKIKVSYATGGMYYKMNVPRPYPYYIWGMTLDDNAHIVYNVAHQECDLDKLCEITKGKTITDKFVFLLNKDRKSKLKS